MKAFKILCVIAWRNLWRNWRRTLLTSGTISGGLALLLLFFGLEDGAHRQMLQNAVYLGGAHVAVEARGYQQKKAIELTLPLSRAASMASVLSDYAFGPATAVPRVFASGLASSSDGSSAVNIMGIDPGIEAQVSLLGKSIVAGSFFSDSSANAAVIGQGVSRKLKLAVGQKCVLMAQGPGMMEIQSVLIRVVGVVRSGVEDIDQFGMLVPLSTAQALLGLPGRIHQVAFILDDPDRAGPAAEVLRRSVGSDLEVLRWDELMPGLRDLINVDIAGLFIIDAIFFLMIAFLVANTFLMSVLERRREFALLDAVGLTPARRFLSIMLEGIWIGILSVAEGTLVGYGAHTYFHHRGLHLRMFFESGFSVAGTSMEPIIYSVLSARRIAMAAGLVLLLTVLLALVPAWKAATEDDAHLLGQV